MRSCFAPCYFYKYKWRNIVYLDYIRIKKDLSPEDAEKERIHIPQWTEHPSVRRITRKIKCGQYILITKRIGESEYL